MAVSTPCCSYNPVIPHERLCAPVNRPCAVEHHSHTTGLEGLVRWEPLASGVHAGFARVSAARSCKTVHINTTSNSERYLTVAAARAEAGRGRLARGAVLFYPRLAPLPEPGGPYTLLPRSNTALVSRDGECNCNRCIYVRSTWSTTAPVGIQRWS